MRKKSDKLDRILKSYFLAEEKTEQREARPEELRLGAFREVLSFSLPPAAPERRLRRAKSPCLSSDQIVLYLAKKLSESDVARLDAHLARCSRCTRLVASVARSKPQEG